MSKIALIAKFAAADGKRAELIATLEKIFPAVEQESGTEVYVLHEDAADDNTVWFYELYTDNDAFSVHGSSDAMKELIGSLGGGLVAGPPEMHMIRPVRGKGVTV